MTPSAVPQPAVASAPVLQCVSTRSGRSTPTFLTSQSAPYAPMARFASTSSRWTAAASASTASSPSSKRAITRSTHTMRFTAVGRAARTRATAARVSSADQPSRSPCNSASATPYAPAAPIAGAPRTTSRWMASTSPSTSRISRVSVRCGSAVWSMSARLLPVQSTARSSWGMGGTPDVPKMRDTVHDLGEPQFETAGRVA